MRKTHKNGDVIWLRETGQVIGNGAGSVLLLACEDITETHQLTEKLSYQATHDDLTGLINRWEFERRLTRALEGAMSSLCCWKGVPWRMGGVRPRACLRP